jgi:hypothetical protein
MKHLHLPFAISLGRSCIAGCLPLDTHRDIAGRTASPRHGVLLQMADEHSIAADGEAGLPVVSLRRLACLIIRNGVDWHVGDALHHDVSDLSRMDEAQQLLRRDAKSTSRLAHAQQLR